MSDPTELTKEALVSIAKARTEGELETINLDYLGRKSGQVSRLLSGIGMVAFLMLAVLLAHAVPLGVSNTPHHGAGLVALAGMSLMYLGLATLQWRQGSWGTWRRWSYAGFYIDEFYTRLALRLWPTRWSGTETTTFTQ